MKNKILGPMLISSVALLISAPAYADLTTKMTIYSSSTILKRSHRTPLEKSVAQDWSMSDGKKTVTMYLSGNKMKTVFSPDADGSSAVYLQNPTSRSMTVLLLPLKMKYVTVLPAPLQAHDQIINTQVATYAKIA